MNGKRVATKTTYLADKRIVEDKWKYECNDGFVLLHSQDGVVECNSDAEVTLTDVPTCLKSWFEFLVGMY